MIFFSTKSLVRFVMTLGNLGSLSKKEFFFLATGFLVLVFRTITLKIQEGTYRITLLCCLIGLSCVPKPFNRKEKKYLFETMTLEVRKDILF